MSIRLEEFENSQRSLSAAQWRARVAARKLQIGLWAVSTSPVAAEILGLSGADWIIIDAEHAPNTPTTISQQLQVLESAPVFTVVRASSQCPRELGRILDAGARGLMVPMVESRQQAEDAVAATRYPPRGFRGVGGGFARATRWSAISDYLIRVDEAISVLVQVETIQGMQALPEILSVEGVDGVFFGPADLAASMGFVGEPRHLDVQQSIARGVRMTAERGKLAAVQAFNYDDARKFEREGAFALAVGADVTLLSSGSAALIARFTETESE